MKIYGPLPATFGRLEHTHDLYLSDNQLSGTLPVEWSRLGGLASDLDLRLSNNQLDGPLPPKWGGHPCMINLELQYNTLTGPLPPEWSDFPTLNELELNSNELTGSLSEQWSALSSLEKLLLQNNGLQGPMPASMSAMTGLHNLDLSRNHINGSIPVEFSALYSLTQLILGDNELTGGLPKGLLPLTLTPPMLVAVDVSENNMLLEEDWYPPNWSTEPQYNGTQLNDAAAVLLGWKATLPAGRCLGCQDGPVFRTWDPLRSICDWNEEVELPGKEGGQARGVIRCRRSSQDIRKLDLRDMEVAGTLPRNFSRLERMSDLYLDNNHLTGAIPREWTRMGLLADDLDLRVADNSLTGQLPPELGAHPSLFQLDAGGNAIAGLLPPEWSSLRLLRRLSLRGNRLSGTLPPAWSALTALQRLELQGNALRGPLPPTWAALSRLQHLLLTNNRLTGELPVEWSHFDAVHGLVLDGNMIGQRDIERASAGPNVSAAPVPAASPPTPVPALPERAEARLGHMEARMNVLGLALIITAAVAVTALLGCVVAWKCLADRRNRAYAKDLDSDRSAEAPYSPPQEIALGQILLDKKPTF
eukprot:jgi/Tetstr1/439220/TSEL_027662.t1